MEKRGLLHTTIMCLLSGSVLTELSSSLLTEGRNCKCLKNAMYHVCGEVLGPEDLKTLTAVPGLMTRFLLLIMFLHT